MKTNPAQYIRKAEEAPDFFYYYLVLLRTEHFEGGNALGSVV